MIALSRFSLDETGFGDPLGNAGGGQFNIWNFINENRYVTHNHRAC